MSQNKAYIINKKTTKKIILQVFQLLFHLASRHTHSGEKVIAQLRWLVGFQAGWSEEGLCSSLDLHPGYCLALSWNSLWLQWEENTPISTNLSSWKELNSLYPGSVPEPPGFYLECTTLQDEYHSELDLDLHMHTCACPSYIWTAAYTLSIHVHLHTNTRKSVQVE